MEAVLHEELTGWGSSANSPIPSPECSLGCQSTVGCIRWHSRVYPAAAQARLSTPTTHISNHTREPWTTGIHVLLDYSP